MARQWWQDRRNDLLALGREHGAAFVDVGNVYGFGTDFDLTDQRYAVGGGIRWQSPFGPIRVDYGINPDRRLTNGPGTKREDFGAIQFSVGSPF